MKTSVLCMFILSMFVCVYSQGQASNSQQAANIIRRLMAARLAQQATKTAPIVPGVRPIIIPSHRPAYNPMGNFWRTAMMANMLSGDGMVLFD